MVHQKVLTTKASPFRHFFFYYVHFYGCIFFLSHILFFTNYFLFFLTIFHTLFLLLPFFTYFFLHVFSARIFLHIFFYTSIFSILFWRDQNNILTAFRNSADLHLFNDFFFRGVGFMNGDAMEFGNDFICGVICCFLFLFHWLNLVLIFVWGTLILKRFQFDWLAINYLF